MWQFWYTIYRKNPLETLLSNYMYSSTYGPIKFSIPLSGHLYFTTTLQIIDGFSWLLYSKMGMACKY